jgi:outer membrane beta-barrel protein
MTKTIKWLASVGFFLGVFSFESLAKDIIDPEVRVVRPRFFNKQYKFEFSTGVAGINRTYQQTLLGVGALSFYLTEWLSIGGYGSYGFSFETQVKTTLNEEKTINELDSITKSTYGGSLSLFPMYGKFQIASGALFYFDTFVSAGVGKITKHYEHKDCVQLAEGSSNIETTRKPDDKSYNDFVVGVGQHYFMNRSSSFNWSFKYSTHENYAVDLFCDENAKRDKRTWKNDLMLQIGLSYFLG